MSFFSWVTQDTKKSIANHYSVRPVFAVYMMNDKGECWKETNYEGYGEFGGKDYFVLLAEMNSYKGLENDDELRTIGLRLAHGKKQNLKFPNLVEYPESWQYTPTGPTECNNQGYFYPGCSEFEEIAKSQDFQDWRRAKQDSLYWENRIKEELSKPCLKTK